MEDFFYAGGLRALMKQLEERLDTSGITVTGKTLGENIDGAEVYNDDVIRPLSNPVYHEGSLAVLRGNLCPDGAVIKPAACDPKYHVASGPALVFDSYPEMKKAIDDENLDVTPDHVLVLRNAGPLGGPGMPEWGMLPHPQGADEAGPSRHAAHLRRAHVRHLLRRLRAACGARELHRRAAGAAADRRHRAARPAATAGSTCWWTRPSWSAAAPRGSRPNPATSAAGAGCSSGTSTQADKGCDFDFLERDFGKAAGEPDIY